MVFPKQTLTVRDPGLGVIDTTADPPLLTGIATGGSQAVNTIGSCNSLADVRSLIGYGPLAEDVALALSQRGGPVLFVRHNSAQSVALTNAAMAGPVSPAVTISGSPNDKYSIRIEIVLGGTRGIATYRYSLDSWDNESAPRTWSQVRLTPSGGTFVMPNSGLTINFPAGTYVALDAYTLDVIPQEPGTVDLATVAAAIIASPTTIFGLWSLVGNQPDETTASAVAAALGSHLTTLTQSYRFARGFADAGSGDTAANVLLEAANWTTSRVCPSYGYELRQSQLAFEGFTWRKVSCSSGIAVRAMRELISTDLSRFASGPDEGVRKIYFDGFYDQTLDAAKISTMRTWIGAPGFYIANGKLKSAFGSDFTDVQYGRVMDVASRQTYESQLPYTSRSFRANADGTIVETDAKTMEGKITNDLEQVLLVPDNAEGFPGHVSALSYSVDLTNNIVTTSQLKTEVALRPLGYAKDISTTLFFALNV